jgi:hypothetical protein
LLAAIRGEYGEAVEHARAGRERAAGMGARPLVAQLCVEEAGARLRRAAPGDEAEAARLATRGAELAASLGMDSVFQAASELIEGRGAHEEDRVIAPRAAARQRTTARLQRSGDHWTIGYSGEPFTLRDVKGIHHLARLISQPGVEVHALDLVAGESGVDPASRGRGRFEPELVVRDTGEGDAGPVLDADAKEAYRTRIEELRGEVEEAELFNDPERAARARQELDFISRELAAAVGLGGRDRKVASASERARVNATRAIKSAIERISEHDQALGRHLKVTVRTGTFCVYDPEPGGPTWEVAVDKRAPDERGAAGSVA